MLVQEYLQTIFFYYLMQLGMTWPLTKLEQRKAGIPPEKRALNCTVHKPASNASGKLKIS